MMTMSNNGSSQNTKLRRKPTMSVIRLRSEAARSNLCMIKPKIWSIMTSHDAKMTSHKGRKKYKTSNYYK